MRVASDGASDYRRLRALTLVALDVRDRYWVSSSGATEPCESSNRARHTAVRGRTRRLRAVARRWVISRA